MIADRQLKTVDRGSLVIRQRESVNMLKQLIRDEQPEKQSFERITNIFKGIKEYKINLGKNYKKPARKSLKLSTIIFRQNLDTNSWIKENKTAINQSTSRNSNRESDSFCPTSKNSQKSYRFSMLSQFSSNKILIIEEDESVIQTFKNLKIKELTKTRTQISHQMIALKQKGKSTEEVQKLIRVVRIIQGSFRQFKIRIGQIQKYIQNLQSLCSIERMTKCEYLRQCIKQFQTQKVSVLQQSKEQFTGFAFVEQLIALFSDEINQLNVLVTLFGHPFQDKSLEIIRKKIKNNKLTDFELQNIRKYCQKHSINI